MEEHGKLISRCPKKLHPRRFDMFGSTVSFTVGEEDSYKTNCGFVFTVLFYIVVLLALSYYGTELFREDQPKL